MFLQVSQVPGERYGQENPERMAGAREVTGLFPSNKEGLSGNK